MGRWTSWYEGILLFTGDDEMDCLDEWGAKWRISDRLPWCVFLLVSMTVTLMHLVIACAETIAFMLLFFFPITFDRSVFTNWKWGWKATKDFCDHECCTSRSFLKWYCKLVCPILDIGSISSFAFECYSLHFNFVATQHTFRISQVETPNIAFSAIRSKCFVGRSIMLLLFRSNVDLRWAFMYCIWCLYYTSHTILFVLYVHSAMTCGSHNFFKLEIL